MAKPTCPYCGKEPYTSKTGLYYICETPGCPLAYEWIMTGDWGKICPQQGLF